MRTLLSLILAISLTAGTVPALGAAEHPVLATAPLNPDFVKYISGNLNQEAGGRRLGRIPPMVGQPAASGIIAGGGLKMAATFPPIYDLRSLSKVTSVKDQAYSSACWAFASLGSLESYLLPGENRDFSENNMKNLLSQDYPQGFDRTHDYGGNSYMSTAYLARWTGPVNETSDPYDSLSGVSPTGLAPEKHVQQVLFLPERTGPLDNNAIKDALMKYGALYGAYYHDDNYYNSGNHAYYYNGSEPANHAVTFAGWDDTYPRTNFGTVSQAAYPEGDGAFIVKNSWGTAWGDNGYFYISYYDTSLTEFTSFNNAEPTNNYTGIYQYDPLGWTNRIGYKDIYNQPLDTAWGANIFTAAAGEEISAVSFYTTPGTNYEIRVYTGVGSGAPVSGTLMDSQSGSTGYQGYYTIPLQSTVPVSAGTKFSIVVKMTNTEGYPLPVENPSDKTYSSKATASAGQSFVSYNGVSWDDLFATAGYENTNLCIKAFSSPPAPVQLTADTTDNNVDNNLEITFADNPAWRAAVTAVMAGNVTLRPNTDYTIETGKITLLPGGGNSALQTTGNATIRVKAAGYGDAVVIQPILHGALDHLAVTRQPVPGTYSGYVFSIQPQVTICDKYGNAVSTSVYSTASVTAAPKEGDTWTLGGNKTVTAVNGVAYFTGLTHSGGQNNAVITFTSGALTVDSSPMNLPSATPPLSGGGGGAAPVGTKVSTGGGKVTASGVTVIIPAGAVENDIRVNINKTAGGAGINIPDGSLLAGNIVDIVKDKSGNFSKPVTITLSFDKLKIDLQKYTISIYWYDESNKQWVELQNVTVNPDNGTVSGETSHFTKFALLAKEKPAVASVPAKPQGQTETAPGQSNFADIYDHWAEIYIRTLATAGIISGYPDGTFLPDKTITRAEFASIIVKAFKLQPVEGTVFEDTAAHWAKDAIATAAAYGIVKGFDDGLFHPDSPVTRQQMAIMTVKAAGLAIDEGQLEFNDNNDIADWSIAAVATAVGKGIMRGYEDNTFRPKREATRAEACAVIYNMLNNQLQRTQIKP
ncbi:MAG: lectin like domain-containing protein [Bacillota bacterium]